jgi:hypothetical protein
MVSTNHFRQELRAQLGRAATQGHIDILVNSGELPTRPTLNVVIDDGRAELEAQHALEREIEAWDMTWSDYLTSAAPNSAWRSARVHP